MVTLVVQPTAWNANSPYDKVVPAGVGALTTLLKLVDGSNVQLLPPPESVAVAVPAIPGTVPVTVMSKGVTLLDAADADPVPATLVAVTVKV